MKPCSLTMEFSGVGRWIWPETFHTFIATGCYRWWLLFLTLFQIWLGLVIVHRLPFVSSSSCMPYVFAVSRLWSCLGTRQFFRWLKPSAPFATAWANRSGLPPMHRIQLIFFLAMYYFVDICCLGSVASWTWLIHWFYLHPYVFMGVGYKLL